MVVIIVAISIYQKEVCSDRTQEMDAKKKELNQ